MKEWAERGVVVVQYCIWRKQPRIPNIYPKDNKLEKMNQAQCGIWVKEFKCPAARLKKNKIILFNGVRGQNWIFLKFIFKCNFPKRLGLDNFCCLCSNKTFPWFFFFFFLNQLTLILQMSSECECVRVYRSGHHAQPCALVSISKKLFTSQFYWNFSSQQNYWNVTSIQII